MNFKKAYTLAEVITAIVIIGVIASLVTFISFRNMDKEFDVKFDKISETITANIREDLVNRTGFGFGDYTPATYKAAVINNLDIKSIYENGAGNIDNFWSVTRLLDNGNVDVSNNYDMYRLEDNTVIAISTTSNRIFVDVNGTRGPNRIGEDIREYNSPYRNIVANRNNAGPAIPCMMQYCPDGQNYDCATNSCVCNACPDGFALGAGCSCVRISITDFCSCNGVNCCTASCPGQACQETSGTCQNSYSNRCPYNYYSNPCYGSSSTCTKRTFYDEKGSTLGVVETYNNGNGLYATGTTLQNMDWPTFYKVDTTSGKETITFAINCGGYSVCDAKFDRNGNLIAIHTPYKGDCTSTSCSMNPNPMEICKTTLCTYNTSTNTWEQAKDTDPYVRLQLTIIDEFVKEYGAKKST